MNRLEMMRRVARGRVLSTRTPPGALAIVDVFQRYRGLDGQPWPDLAHASFNVEDGLAEVADWPLVEDYVHRLPCRDECDVIGLGRVAGNTDLADRAGWSLAGFDVGCFESEYSHFSVILNEVLLGRHEDLRVFAARLNQHLLLPSVEHGLQIVAERDRLLALGTDLEQEPPSMEPIAVYVRLSV